MAVSWPSLGRSTSHGRHLRAVLILFCCLPLQDEEEGETHMERLVRLQRQAALLGGADSDDGPDSDREQSDSEDEGGHAGGVAQQKDGKERHGQGRHQKKKLGKRQRAALKAAAATVTGDGAKGSKKRQKVAGGGVKGLGGSQLNRGEQVRQTGPATSKKQKSASAERRKLRRQQAQAAS